MVAYPLRTTARVGIVNVSDLRCAAAWTTRCPIKTQNEEESTCNDGDSAATA